MRIWIVRKHPPLPYYSQRGHLAAFTIHGAYRNRALAKAEADDRNKRSKYLFTVHYVELKTPDMETLL